MAAAEETDCDFTISTLNIQQLCSETILGFIFWSLFTALVPMIWFYPLNELDLTGYEAFAVLYLTPLLMGNAKLRSLFQTRWGLAILRLGVLASLASFQAETTLQRLVILSLGCGFLMLQFVATIWSSSPINRLMARWGLILGYFAYLSGRIWFVSFIPTWMDNYTNSIVIAIGALATFGKIFSGEDGTSGDIVNVKGGVSCLVIGLGFGCVLHVTQCLYGEVSLISRWVVSGYPHTGPHPYTAGILTLLALFAGILISQYRKLVTNVFWWILGCCGLAALYCAPREAGFTGGIFFAIYLMSIWPEYLERVSRCPPGRTMCVAILVYIALMLYNVWTIAYNFLPGGEYTRERTDIYLIFVALCIGLGLYVSSGEADKQELKGPSCSVLIMLVLIISAGLAGFMARYKPLPSHPIKAHPHADFTAAIWTYHFGYDNQGWPSLERSATLLNNTNADVITLLESDASKPFLGNNDLAMWLGERLNMYVDFGPSTRDHTWGNLLLSKYPIVKSTHHLLPSPHGELAPAITATIDIGGHLVDFVVTHMGNDRDVLDRKLQSQFLAKELKTVQNPAVFLGYVTSQPFSNSYRTLTGSGAKDIDDTDPDRWCEYIMYKNLIRLNYARVSNGGLSDTELQMARFRIPEDPEDFKDNDRIVTDKNKIPAGDQLTKVFGPFKKGHSYSKGHRYHMDTPKYFVSK